MDPGGGARDASEVVHHIVLRPEGGVPIKAWVQGVTFDPAAQAQLAHTARLPFVFHHVAAMPDVHVGIGATVGSVVPTKGAIVPAAVGVDIGCGMAAVQTTLTASDLPESLGRVRSAIEAAVPVGRTNHGAKGDRGAWGKAPAAQVEAWRALSQGYDTIAQRFPKVVRNAHPIAHLGTLGSGNHFIELCLDETQQVWMMLHSGSRGIGNRIGTFFIERAKEELARQDIHLPDQNLAYFKEGSPGFDAYVMAVSWAQGFARQNRALMMEAALGALRQTRGIPPFAILGQAVNCHHNYVAEETHFGERVFVTRKGAVRAGKGDLGIIPGSMGARSFIVRGLGNPESFESCSHGAGRQYSRTQARKQFTLEDHARATAGIECRKDDGVLDETPGAYKPIDAVMAAQADLVEIVHTLKQLVCVKG